MNFFFIARPEISLRKVLLSIKGVGEKEIKSICKKIGFSPHLRWASLSSNQKTNFLFWFEENIVKKKDIGPNLTNFENSRKKKLKKLNSYKAVRLKKKLPCNGQRTKSNAKTAGKLN